MINRLFILLIAFSTFSTFSLCSDTNIPESLGNLINKLKELGKEYISDPPNYEIPDTKPETVFPKTDKLITQ